MSTAAQPVQVLTSRSLYGAAAGIGGGIAFGAVMAATGMLPMVAMLVGSEHPAVGAVVHLVISALLGVVFALLVPFSGVWALLGTGIAYGAIWWVLGGLLLMPAALGMPVFTLGATATMSLIGHLLYGVVTAVALYGIRRQTRHV